MFCNETQEHIPLGVYLLFWVSLFGYVFIKKKKEEGKEKRKSEQELTCKMYKR